jgi:hypothetical protein
LGIGFRGNPVYERWLPMKVHVLLLSVLSLLPAGCGLLGRSLNTVGQVINTVTSPIRSLSNLAEPGSEEAWQNQQAAGTQPTNSPRDDRRSSSPKRRD